MGKKVFKTRALKREHEIELSRTVRDTRTLGERIADFFKDPLVLGVTFAMMGLFVIVFPVLLIPFFLIWGILMLVGWHEAAYQTLVGKLPRDWVIHVAWLQKIPLLGKWLYKRAITDWNDPKPGWIGYHEARGETLWGYDRDTGQEIYLTDNEMLTHMVIFGTTGAGKTESLLSIGFNAIASGTGLFYSDAKGTVKLSFQLWNMARYVGRDDDYLVINYITGNQQRADRHPERTSNTVNPFTYGTADFLADIVNSLAISGEGDDKNAVFTDGAIQLMKSLMVGLVEMRDQGRINLSVRVIREWLSLDKCIEIAEDPSLSEFARETMREYLKKIPGFIEGKSAAEQGEKTQEQFGYNQFYFRRALSMLTDSYGHIYGALMGEVDFKDIVMNRRIVCVSLPALEKAPNELSQLGRVILAGLKSAMSLGLGSKAEGTKENALDALPSNSEKISLYILDEYGYQAVDGFAVTAAQARGLGCSMIFAGQDYAGFKRGNEREAEQVVANTKFKSFMALEDPQSTWELVKQLAGEGVFSEVDGFELGSETDAYTPGTNAKISRAARIDMMDLRQQIEGDFHLLYKDGIYRGSMFHAGPDISGGMQINQLVEVEKPDGEEISRRYAEIKFAKELFHKMYEGKFELDSERANVTPATMRDSVQFMKELEGALGFTRPRMGVREALLGLATSKVQEELQTDKEEVVFNKREESKTEAEKEHIEEKPQTEKMAQTQSASEPAQTEARQTSQTQSKTHAATSALISMLAEQESDTEEEVENPEAEEKQAQIEKMASEVTQSMVDYPIPPKPEKKAGKKEEAMAELMSMFDA